MKYLGNILGVYILHIISDQLKKNQIDQPLNKWFKDY